MRRTALRTSTERRRQLRARRQPRRIPHLAGRDLRPIAAATSRPPDLHWSLERDGSSWTLGLRLDDKALPLPYLIDPIALIAACGLAAGPGRHDELHRDRARPLVESRDHEAVGRGCRRRARRAADRPLDRRDHAADRLEPDRHDGAGRHRHRSSRRSYWHLVDGTEGSPFTFSWTGGNADASGGIVTYKGVDPFIGLDQGGSAALAMSSGGTAATGNPAGLAITTTAANEMLQAAYGVANG